MKNHKHSLRTRRDFLSHGLMSFGAVMTLPVLSQWPFNAMAQSPTATCEGADGTYFLPFIAFDMAGGASLPANFLVGKQGGPEDLITSYDKLGWDPRESGALNTDFGLPMSSKYSQLLQGILNTTTAEARKNLRFGSFCHFAQDDSSANRLNAASLIMTTGSRGKFLSTGIGLVDSTSGGNSSPVLSNNSLKPAFVRSVTDVLGATSFGGISLKPLSAEQKVYLAQTGVSLSEIQKADYMAEHGGETLAELSECSYKKSETLLQDTLGLDPRTDASVQQAYGINTNTNASDSLAVSAAISMNTLKNYSGPSTWTLGGCDYHDGTQTSGDNKDLEMGLQIGRAIQLAYLLQKPLFFQLLTDGGCDAEIGTRRWRGDSGDKCMTVIGYYHPTKTPEMLRLQVGHYTNGQGAERSTLIGSEPALVGYAVLANYLNVLGRLSEFRTLAPGVFTTEAQLKSVLIFKGSNA